MKSNAKGKDQVVLRPAQVFQGDLPCHASNASNKAFSKTVSEPSRSWATLVISCPESTRLPGLYWAGRRVAE